MQADPAACLPAQPEHPAGKGVPGPALGMKYPVEMNSLIIDQLRTSTG